MPDKLNQRINAARIYSVNFTGLTAEFANQIISALRIIRVRLDDLDAATTRMTTELAHTSTTEVPHLASAVNALRDELQVLHADVALLAATEGS